MGRINLRKITTGQKATLDINAWERLKRSKLKHGYVVDEGTDERMAAVPEEVLLKKKELIAKLKEVQPTQPTLPTPEPIEEVEELPEIDVPGVDEIQPLTAKEKPVKVTKAAPKKTEKKRRSK